jgi:hypothetical protein
VSDIGVRAGPGAFGQPLAEIRLAGHLELLVHPRHDGGAMLRLKTRLEDRQRQFSLHIAVEHLPFLITALLEIEQAAIDRLSEPAGDGAAP